MAGLGLALGVLGACVAQEQTNRELERMSRDYERQQAEQEQANRPPVTRPANDTCGLTENAGLVGTAEADLHPPANARVICAGCMATMDFNATRLTIQMGPDHKVASLRCG